MQSITIIGVSAPLVALALWVVLGIVEWRARRR